MRSGTLPVFPLKSERGKSGKEEERKRCLLVGSSMCPHYSIMWLLDEQEGDRKIQTKKNKEQLEESWQYL